jgi:molybdopterin-containing oxidoreductase family membrane subunit
MMMEPRMNRYTKQVGLLALCWRFVLTSGTGAIFGFLVAREAYDTAIMAPMFIVMSLAQGTAVFLLVSTAVFHWSGYRPAAELVAKLRRLLAIFILVVLYLVVLYHLTNLYIAQHHGVERFILLDGGVYTVLFWGVQVIGGSVLPVWLFLSPRFSARGPTVIAALLVVLGGLAQLYVIIIGGQAYPLNIMPGYRLQSGFFDGVVASYAPSLPELVLGLGGVGLAGLLAVLALRVLPFLPTAMPTTSSVNKC